MGYKKMGYLVRSKRFNVHLSCLDLEGLLVGPDGLDNGAVVEEDKDHREEVIEEADEENVTPVV